MFLIVILFEQHASYNVITESWNSLLHIRQRDSFLQAWER